MKSSKSNLLVELAAGDLRTTGAADSISARILKEHRLVAQVFSGLSSEDPGLRMRCADALAKVASKEPKLLAPFKRELLNEISVIDQQEVQWHVAEILGYVDLTPGEAIKAGKILEEYFDTSKSRIVRVNALQALVVLSRKHAFMRDAANVRLALAAKSGIPSLAARARKLSK